MNLNIEEMKRDREAGTPDKGGWSWFGGRDDLYLATNNGGRQFVMTFQRKGMRSGQPCFQIGGIMRPAIDDLAEYEVGDKAVRGQKQADADRSVYRMDVKGVDHPDARRIARVPDMEARILSDAARIAQLERERDEARDRALADALAAIDDCFITPDNDREEGQHDGVQSAYEAVEGLRQAPPDQTEADGEALREWPLDTDRRWWVGEQDGNVFDADADWSGVAVTIEVRSESEAKAVAGYFLGGDQ